MSKKVHRLSAGFKPSAYTISLEPDRAAKTLTGIVTIKGKKAGRPGQRLTFHQRGLKITQATVTKHDKKGAHSVKIDRINHQRSLDEVRLHSPELIYAGEYTIEMHFTGQISHHMEGIYPCNFVEDDQKKQLIATQFESHAARQAFPCIDEPEAKATFDLTVTSPINETILANTPVKHQQAEGDILTTTFETTPVMSTYLLAFVYGNLQSREQTTRRGTQVRCFATRDNIAHTDFALNVAVRCLEFFEDYFAIPFPLPKCDLVALPDFAAGAMENWGLITFREQCLLVDPDNTSLPTKQYVAEVICHELTHQWFGNLVTMKWWNDLWLNEGFANIMAYYAVDKLFPEWHMMTQYIAAEQQSALKLDALKHTHPIEVAVNNPDEIPTIFDAISYNKGGSCILMLMTYLGETAFRDGLRHYLKTHAYQNTITGDLWEALETVSKKPVKAMMATWTGQAGYPVITADISDKQVTLSQQRFLISPESRKQHDNIVWPVALRAGDELPDMFDDATLTAAITKPEELKLNRGQTSFCRVIYNKPHLDNLTTQIRQGTMPVVDRLGILGDAFETAKAGYSSTVNALHLLESFTDETDDNVWDVIAGNLGSIRTVMDDEALREAMKPFVRTLASKQLARLGWDAKPNEPHFDTLLRPTILGLAAVSDEPTVVAEAVKRFTSAKKATDIAPDIRGIVYTTAALHGDAKTFDRLLQMLKTTTSAEETVTLAAALTNFKQPDLVKRALELINSDVVRLQDVSYWIAYSLANRFSRQASWEWLKTHWQWLKDNFGTETAFTHLPLYAARVMSNETYLADYQQFFASVMEPAIERSYQQGVEAITWQSAWRSRDYEPLLAYFKALAK